MWELCRSILWAGCSRDDEADNTLDMMKLDDLMRYEKWQRVIECEKQGKIVQVKKETVLNGIYVQ